MFAATALIAVGWWLMLRLETPSAMLFIAGSVVIGACFGAAAGVLAHRPWLCTLLGASGWFLFSIYAIVE
jgi:hypothetical protein